MSLDSLWVQVAIGMGSNLGDRLAHLHHGADALAHLPECQLPSLSPIYETAAVDCTQPLPFLNAVALIETQLPARRLLEHLLNIENQLGRERSYVNAPRHLDLDLLLYGDQVLDHPDLVVPHPRLHQRLFVLTPLAQLMGEHLHPVLGQSLSSLEQTQKQLVGEQDGVSLSSYVWPKGHFT